MTAKFMTLEESRKSGWAYYQHALKGQDFPIHPRFAPIGFYRVDNRHRTKSWPLAIWQDGDKKYAQIGDAPVIDLSATEAEEDFVDKTFQYCSRKPVDYAAYEHWKKHREWPAEPVADAIAESEKPLNTNATPDVILGETIAELRAEAEKWIESIGGEVTNKEQADKAADFASRFSELEKEADEARLSGRRPHLDRAEEVQKTWQPIVKAGADAKSWAKALTTKWQQAERARLLREAADKAAAGEAVTVDALKVKAGTRGRAVSLRTRQEPHVTDLKALIEHYRNEPRFWAQPAVLAALGAIAGADTKAGQTIPGFRFVTVESVA